MIEGRSIKTSWGKGGLERFAKLETPEYFERSSQRQKAEADRKSKTRSQRGMKPHIAWAERDKAAIAPARAYWSEVERITKASGIEAAQEAHVTARDALAAHVDAIMKAPALTMEGVAIKAQALAAWGTVERFWRVVRPEASQWATQLAEAILEQAQGDAVRLPSVSS